MKQMYSALSVIFCTLLFTQTAKAQCGLSATGKASISADNNIGLGGTLSWSNPGNTTAVDGNYATAGGILGLFTNTHSDYLLLSGFGFNIPAGYAICGVGLNITRNSGTLLSINNYVSDHIVQLATMNAALVAPTLLGGNQALTGSGNAWPQNNGTVNYGGNGNTMGATLTPAIVNAANFGVAISAQFNTAISLGLYANIDFVGMSIYTNPVIVLPITLEHFSVTGDAEGNTINWTAAANDIANQFIVQRSGNGTTWQNIATLTASTGSESYSYTDTNPLSGPNYYRLELANTDGTTGYSIIGIISGRSTTPGIHFYPNPFHDMINITASGTFTRLSLRDLAGRTLWVKEYPGGITSTQIPAGDLPQGMYFITVDGATYKLVKN